MVCLNVKVSTFYLAPFPSYFDGSFRDTQTDRHALLHVGIKQFLLRKSLRLKTKSLNQSYLQQLLSNFMVTVNNDVIATH
jgi:hypothetical protein